MSECISWLHLTDLHLGQPNGWFWPVMRQQFYEDLAALAERAGPWDLVFFSGDFVQQGTQEEFQKVRGELERLWQHLAGLGSKPLLFAVPGNHDLLRPGETAPIAGPSKHWHGTEEEELRKEFWSTPDCWSRQAITKAFSNYSEWLSNLPLVHSNITHGLLPGDFSAVIPKGEVRLGIIGLNTTYLQLTKANYEGRLDVHLQQMQAVCRQASDLWRKDIDMAVLMTHQPPDWLHPDAQRQLNEIYGTGRFDAHFCGHLHQAKTRDLSEAGGSMMRLRQGASLFGLEKYAVSQTERQFGYTLGRWEIHGDTGTETLWPRLARIARDGIWTLGPNPGFHLDVDNSTTTRLQLQRREQPVESPKDEQGGGNRTTKTPPVEVRIVQIESPLDETAARQRLKSVPRFRLHTESHHYAVREEEQKRLADLLKGRRAAWLVADWGYGKEGFLACALDRMGGQEALLDVYRIQCGLVDKCDELVAAAETQLGVSFQEFLAAVAALPSSVLVLDDLPQSLITGDEREAFERKIRPLFDFCPSLKLIFVSRQAPESTESTDIVLLHQLDVPETRNYLKLHPRWRQGLGDDFELERIHSWSGGLPMHLDRLLERIEFVKLLDILDDSVELPMQHSKEPIPESLPKAVSKLSKSDIKVLDRSFKLLKVLTVLRDGETFQSIKRFYEREPFYQDDIDELVGLALLESVTIAQTGADISVHSARYTVFNEPIPKLLRVPRQVRDYVNSLISDDERDDIISTSTGLFFGPNWFQGKIRPRRALLNAYGQSAIAGPGNEHVVARHLLSKALSKNKRQVDRYALLALGYCRKLMSEDRFRDALVMSRVLVDLLEATEYDKHYVEAAHIYGRALRMTGHEEDAVDVLLKALERGAAFLIDDNKAAIKLSLAVAYQDIENGELAVAAAREVIALAHADTNDALQAEGLVADTVLKGNERKRRLTELKERARNLKHNNAANNIALTLSRSSDDREESLRLLQEVLYSAKDSYNRTRAIIEKVTILGNHVRLSELKEEDQRLLSAAYSYSYAQRIGNLLDDCHKVLWRMFLRENLWDKLIRLFRFSSFVWRLKGIEEREGEYLKDLDAVDIEGLKRTEGKTLIMEIVYLEKRRESRAPKAT